MKYLKIKEGLFLKRPNRFIAHVLVEGQEAVCHVKNTGRCRELLIPGKTKVFLEEHSENSNRKTKYSLVTVEKNKRLINMDSQAPNQVAQEWLESGGIFEDLTYLKREQKFGNSRFDIYFEHGKEKGFMEVKGVTLEENNIVRFPDAPTERGVKHIMELIKAKEQGYEAYILFVIQMNNVKYFEPNYETHKEFGEALKLAEKAGVGIIAMDCIVTEDTLSINKPVTVRL